MRKIDVLLFIILLITGCALFPLDEFNFYIEKIKLNEQNVNEIQTLDVNGKSRSATISDGEKWFAFKPKLNKRDYYVDFKITSSGSFDRCDIYIYDKEKDEIDKETSIESDIIIDFYTKDKIIIFIKVAPSFSDDIDFKIKVLDYDPSSP